MGLAQAVVVVKVEKKLRIFDGVIVSHSEFGQSSFDKYSRYMRTQKKTRMDVCTRVQEINVRSDEEKEMEPFESDVFVCDFRRSALE